MKENYLYAVMALNDGNVVAVGTPTEISTGENISLIQQD
jgi:hypothetical protein